MFEIYFIGMLLVADVCVCFIVLMEFGYDITSLREADSTEIRLAIREGWIHEEMWPDAPFVILAIPVVLLWFLTLPAVFGLVYAYIVRRQRLNKMLLERNQARNLAGQP